MLIYRSGLLSRRSHVLTHREGPSCDMDGGLRGTNYNNSNGIIGYQYAEALGS